MIFVITAIYFIVWIVIYLKYLNKGNAWEFVLDQFGLKKQSNNGSKLLMQLHQVEFGIEKFKEYKWIHHFLDSLLGIKKKFGGDYQVVFELIRNCLSVDLEQERKLEQIYSKGFFQLLLTTLCTLFFAFYSMRALKIELEMIYLFVPIIAWLFSAILFSKFSKFLYKKLINEFDLMVEVSLQIRAFTMIRLPIKTIIEESGLEKLSRQEWKNNVLQARFEWLIENLENWKKFGGDFTPKITSLLNEFLSLRELKLKQLEHYLQFVQFLVTLIVSLPVFFFIIYQILQEQFQRL